MCIYNNEKKIDDYFKNIPRILNRNLFFFQKNNFFGVVCRLISIIFVQKPFKKMTRNVNSSKKGRIFKNSPFDCGWIVIHNLCIKNAQQEQNLRNHKVVNFKAVSLENNINRTVTYTKKTNSITFIVISLHLIVFIVFIWCHSKWTSFWTR